MIVQVSISFPLDSSLSLNPPYIPHNATSQSARILIMARIIIMIIIGIVLIVVVLVLVAVIVILVIIVITVAIVVIASCSSKKPSNIDQSDNSN